MYHKLSLLLFIFLARTAFGAACRQIPFVIVQSVFKITRQLPNTSDYEILYGGTAPYPTYHAVFGVEVKKTVPTEIKKIMAETSCALLREFKLLMLLEGKSQKDVLMREIAKINCSFARFDSAVIGGYFFVKGEQEEKSLYIARISKVQSQQLPTEIEEIPSVNQETIIVMPMGSVFTITK